MLHIAVPSIRSPKIKKAFLCCLPFPSDVQGNFDCWILSGLLIIFNYPVLKAINTKRRKVLSRNNIFDDISARSVDVKRNTCIFKNKSIFYQMFNLFFRKRTINR